MKYTPSFSRKMGCSYVGQGEKLLLVDGLVVAVIDAVAALYALDVVDGELLLFLDNGAVGALGFAGTALDAALGDHICHIATSDYLTSPLRST